MKILRRWRELTNKDDNKDKLRVYEYAKSLNMNSKEIITILKRLNLPVNNHMSVMENDSVHAVEKFFHDIKANAAAKHAAVTTAQSQKNNQSKPASQQEQLDKSTISSIQSNDDTRNQVLNSSKVSRDDLAEQRKKANEQLNKNDKPTSYPSSERTNTSSTYTSRNQSTSYKSTSTSHYAAPVNSETPANSETPVNSSPMDAQQLPSRPAPSNESRNENNAYPSNVRNNSAHSGNGTPSPRSYSSNNTGDPSNKPAYTPRPTGTGNPRPTGTGNPRPTGTGNPRPTGTGNPRPTGTGNPRSDYSSSTQRPNPSYTNSTSSNTRFAPNRDKPKSSTDALTKNRDQPAQASRANDLNRSAANTRTKPPFADKKPPFRKESEEAAKKGSKLAPNRFDDSRSTDSKSKWNSKNSKYKNQANAKKEKVDNTPKKIIVRGHMTVGETAKLLHKDVAEVIKKLLTLGVLATINQELDLAAIELLANAFNVETEIKITIEDDRFETIEETDEAENLLTRPPVVTIMGHVDHGKTTLLDAIRHTNVTNDEAGGITQHIGAYQVEVNAKKITFLDTPGHEAFTTMRARGAQVTDITVLVVAADDGVMPQTIEAINHAKAAKVPIIVAVNKIDKMGANVEKIKQSLTEYELVPEEWGGDTIFCELSAKNKTGIENLLEMILLVAEVQEYKANPNKRARGTIIEAELDKGRGPVARILIQHGTLRVGDSFVAGVCFGRVRAMVNDKGKKIKEAFPSTPIEITGLTEVPQAGDPFMVFEDERKARDIAEKRSIELRQSEMGANSRVTLDELYKQISDGDIKDLFVIIKGDVQGSVEALKGSLEKIEVQGARVKIIHSGVGTITETDVSLASASNAIIIGFNVRPEQAAKTTADQEKVDIRLHSIIYNVIEEITQAMKGILDPIFKEVILGHAQVRNVFKITGSGTIAGCMITDGKVARNSGVRLLRDNIVVYTGKIDSLKRFKDDAKEVAQGYECGISLERYLDIKEGDVIESFILEKVER